MAPQYRVNGFGDLGGRIGHAPFRMAQARTKMRSVLLFFCLVLFGSGALAQAGWLPLSRDVEMPYATAQQAYRSNEHTAIRPYRRKDISLLKGADTLRPEAALNVLDKWTIM